MRAFMALALCSGLLAGEAPARPWTNVTSFSFVATGGNSQGQTLGLANDFGYKWTLSTLTVKASAIRAASTIVTRSATGATLEEAIVSEQRTTTTTAELYTLGARLDHRLKEKDRFYGFVGANWERNRPAGLDSRSSILAGAGRIWADSETTKFRTDLGLGWTYEQPMVVPDGYKQRYGTLNLNAQLKQQLGSASHYAMDLVASDNLSDTADWQGALKQGVTVKINARFALKVGYDLFYRSRPNLIAVDVLTPAPELARLGSLSIPAKKTDTVFTTSLVVTF